MTIDNFKLILNELKYTDYEHWHVWGKITRINLTTNGSLYSELGNEIAEYKIDSSHGLIFKRIVNKKGDVIKSSGIIDIHEVVSVEILNKYSESVFNGNTLLR